MSSPAGPRPLRLRILFAALLALLVAGGAELLARVLLPAGYGYPFVVRADPPDRASRQFDRGAPAEREERSRPGVKYRYDAAGFRLGAPAASGDEVLFLGDSFTMGFLVADEDTYPAAAGRHLQALGRPLRVLNAGLCGLGTAGALRTLRRLLPREGPAAVVWQLYPPNDLIDDLEDGGFGLRDGRLVEHERPERPGIVRLREALWDNPVAARSRLARAVANACCGPTSFRPVPGEAAFALQAAVIEEFARTVRERGVPLLVVVVPAPEDTGARPPPPPGDAVVVPRAHERVVALARRAVPDVLDARPLLDRAEHFLDGDAHLSPAGNERLGAAVAEWLARRVPVAGERPPPDAGLQR